MKEAEEDRKVPEEQAVSEDQGIEGGQTKGGETVLALRPRNEVHVVGVLRVTEDRAPEVLQGTEGGPTVEIIAIPV